MEKIKSSSTKGSKSKNQAGLPIPVPYPRLEGIIVNSFSYITMFPSARNLPDAGVKPATPASAGRFFTTEPQGSPLGIMLLLLLLSRFSRV